MLDYLVISDYMATLYTLSCPLVSNFQYTLSSAYATSCDTKSSLNEPVFGHCEAFADSLQDLGLINYNVLEQELRMLECEVMCELRCTLNANARCILLYEEYGSLVRISVKVCMYKNEVSDVTNCNVPFLTVDLITAIAFYGCGLALCRVRTCISLCDCISITTLSQACRYQLLIDLLLGTEFHRERRLRNCIPDSAGNHTELLGSQCLLK